MPHLKIFAQHIYMDMHAYIYIYVYIYNNIYKRGEFRI